MLTIAVLKQRMLESVINQLIGKAKLGSFCTQIQSEIGDFDLQIEGVGKVRCPVMPKAAKLLISVAKPAAFGKKDKTLYDPSVRNVWEVAADRVNISAAFWEQKLNGVLKKIHKNLGMPKGSHLTAHLHNLLIYERGQFFAPHQDSEKYDGMVATLVVLLPSNFSGGSLKIDQHGDRRTFDANMSTRSTLTFIAFYADCHHEVTKVTAGYRVALTYNLVLAGMPKELPQSQSAALTRNIKTYFEGKNEDEPTYRLERPRWLVYLFDHQYTQNSFQWNSLKGADRETAAQFLAAAKELDLIPHLALADVHEAWAAEGKDDFDYGHRRRYWDSEDDEEEDDDDETSSDPETMDVQDLILHETTLCHWIDEDGKACNIGPKYVSNEMVCWSKANDDFKPIKAEYEGYMGNYGNTVDKWYHRAAIILWPKDTDILSRFEIMPTTVLQKISKQLKDDFATGRANLKKVLSRLENYQIKEPKDSRLLFEMALRSADPQVASKVLYNLGLESILVTTLTSMKPLLETYGEAWFIDQLKSWSKKGHYARSRVGDLEELVTQLHPSFKNLTAWLVSYQREGIFEADRQREKSGLKELMAREEDHIKAVTELLRSAVFHPQEADAMINHILKHQDIYLPISTAKLLLELKSIEISDNLRQCLASSAKVRLSEIISRQRAANDWSIRTLPPCKCKDCKILKDFLSNSSAQSHVWPLAKDRRQHIHQIIDGSALPVTHVTHREGSPHKLVLKKTEELFSLDKLEKKAAKNAMEALEQAFIK
jgi:2OG-Fe(II) oxygenase superfamily